jgi:osmotically-inducible protein OsmY
MIRRDSAPTSYDDIARATVPNPDGSLRPSREQIRNSRPAGGAPAHAMSGDERALLAQIHAALSMEGHTDTHRVDIIVQGSIVILRGTVPGPSTSARIEDVAGRVTGVTEVWNELDIIPTDPTH